MTTHASLTRGITAAKAGDRATARRLLTQAVRRDPESVAAWLWLSSVLDTPQGRAFCLRRVLTLDPDNPAAKRGLSALQTASPARALVTQPSPTTPARPAEGPLPAPGSPIRRTSPSGVLVRQTQFWKVVVGCLAVIALGLIGTLMYAAFSGSSAAEDEVLAAIVPEQSPRPDGTLRPTFTATPNDTSTPVPPGMAARPFTPTETPMPPPLPTDAPTPLQTETPTPTPKSRPRQQSPTVAPTPTPLTQPPPVIQPTPQPRRLDARLPQLRVHVEPASVNPGQPYWRLVEVRWTDERESAGKHSIYVEVWDSQGSRSVGQPVVVQWAGGNVILPVEDVPAPDWGVNFPMYNTLGSYAVHVGGAPSDRIVGLGLGTPETPNFTVHTSFYLTFCLTYR
jgi:hypothetical protein